MPITEAEKCTHICSWNACVAKFLLFLPSQFHRLLINEGEWFIFWSLSGLGLVFWRIFVEAFASWVVGSPNAAPESPPDPGLLQSGCVAAVEVPTAAYYPKVLIAGLGSLGLRSSSAAAASEPQWDALGIHSELDEDGHFGELLRGEALERCLVWLMVSLPPHLRKIKSLSTQMYQIASKCFSFELKQYYADNMRLK